MITSYAVRRLRRNLCAILFGMALSAGVQPARAVDVPSGPAILQDLKSFKQMATVLMIAAHPDDENTQLITYLARGRGYRMAYLSATRGDGGQNVIGPEFGDLLGVIRTQELLAARRLDSGRQFFTRAIDFGYSKDVNETLRTWDRQAAIGDVVRIFRTFKPDVVVTRFSTQPAQGQHGQHTASAVLGVEAFKVSGDPKAYPDQLVGDVKPWQPKRIMLNGGGGGRGGGAPAGDAPAGIVRMDAGGNDPVLGTSFAQISGQSRGMHKSQGFGLGAGGGGGGGAGGPSIQNFQLLAGEAATSDIMDGVDTTWARVPGGAEINTLAEQAIAQFKQDDPAASAAALLAIRAKVAALPHDPIVSEKLLDLDRIISECLGLSVETTVENAEVVPGESIKLKHSARIALTVPVKWISTRYTLISKEISPNQTVKTGSEASTSAESTQTIPANTPVTQAYWLRQEPSVGLHQVSDPTQIGTAENRPVFPIEHRLEIAGQTIILPDEPVQIVPGASPAQARRRLDIIPPVSLRFLSDVRLYAPGAAKPIEVEVISARANSTGALQLNAPAGWRIEPASQPFKLAAVGDRTKLSFSVTAPPAAGSADIRAVADVNGTKFDSKRIEIKYDHLPVQLLHPAAKIRAVAMDLKTKGKSIGYVPGAGDDVAECLEQMGYSVTELKATDLTTEKLKAFDAVVFGVRAFNANVRTDLASHLPDVYAYIEAGGTVIAQYNRPETGATVRIGPYPVRISGDRITDETAKPTFLAPEHAALNVPNKITPADFDGWVQERGIYFPNSWDEHFTPILAFSDPGEQPVSGALLVAPYGKGHFVYTGLVWFRELPAGVPGAYRLFANLVSLGK